MWRVSKPLLIIIPIIFIAFIIIVTTFSYNLPQDTAISSGDEEASGNGIKVVTEVSTTTLSDGRVLKYVVPPDEIVSGGPPKDGIPSIDNPKFVSREEADEFLNGGDEVIGLFYKGVARAYPLKILVWHEIVNDIVAGTPIAITYCPLCYTSIAFIRIIGGEEVEFGVSGKLFNSNLVMYDRKTDTLWSQVWGIGILGPLAGVKLEKVQVDVMAWRLWKQLHPDTEVLSTETGYSRPYGYDPYQGYYESNEIAFPVRKIEKRLYPKQVVYGVEINDVAKAYVYETLVREKVVNDVVGGDEIVIFAPLQGLVRAYERRLEDGTLLEFTIEDGEIVDKQTGSRWSIYGEAISGPFKGARLKPVVIEISFWFAWVAFYPETEIYGG